MVELSRAHDLVVYGATGFVGRLVARWLADRLPGDARWALAGRSPGRLAEVAAGLGRPVSLVTAASEDAPSIERLVSGARVVVSLAGPFHRYSDALARACARHGTHYTDITGEAPWIANLAASVGEEARRSGARVVPGCGFDSIPSDLGTFVLVDRLRAAGAEVRSVSASFKLWGGGLNGGTLATALLAAEAGGGRLMTRGGGWDPERRVWLAPFFMASINAAMVRRTLAAMGGGSVAYAEHVEARSRVEAWKVAATLSWADRWMRSARGRAVIRRFGPKPGEGPSPEAQARGGFRVRLIATTADGARHAGSFADRGDAGNVCTTRYVGSAALALLAGEGRVEGGVWTPAIAFGSSLVDRLRAEGTQIA